MRLWPYALVAIYLGLAITPVAAAECRKPKDEPPLNIHVEFIDSEPTHSNEKTVAEITSLKKTAQASSSHEGQAILGLTVTEINSSQKSEIRWLVRGGTPFCAWLRKLNVKISFTRFDVFVAKEYKPGSCSYAAILAHENQHVAIEKEMAEQLHREALAKLKNVEQKLSTATAPTKEEMNRFLSNTVKPMLDENMATYSERRRKAHAKIDTKESYAKVHASCKDWIKHRK
jgi:hypothetical protein